MDFSILNLSEDYWEHFDINGSDIEFLYNHLLEIETPQPPIELLEVLVDDRLARELHAAEKQRSEGNKTYLPKESYEVGEKIMFPELSGENGTVTAIRDAKSISTEKFKVIEVEFESGKLREYSAELEDHKLNIPPEVSENDPLLGRKTILEMHSQHLLDTLVAVLKENDDFVYIAGRWFPRALIVDVNEGNLNLAEAVLDVAKGGPLLTVDILAQVEFPSGVNQNLAEFSLDMGLQDDPRFDEVGSAGVVSWFLKRQEPKDVLETPLFLRYEPVEYNRELLSDAMLKLEKRLDDELSPLEDNGEDTENQVQVSLIYPHWRAGTVPLTNRLVKFFPTALESPRVRFMFVDGKSGEKFSGWVVRLEKYVHGLREWYLSHGLTPGGIIKLSRGEQPGEIIIDTDSHRSNKEWVRTALIGADGGVVYATLKQSVSTSFDDWMMTYLPSELEALDLAWEKKAASPPAFEQVVVDTLKGLAQLNPQSHVHAAELYSAVNVVYRCPPGPIMALLASRPWFSHVGDLHFRYQDDSEEI